MDSRFKNCMDDGKIVKIGVQIDLVKKELAAAESDLKSCEKSLKENDPKWATVQAYYSMFHSAKALVLSKGFREKSHYCLSVALKALFVDSNLLDSEYYEKFRDCMNLRQEADYGMAYSEKSAGEVAEWAKELLSETKKLLK